MNTVDEVVDRAVEILAQRPSALVTDIDGTLSRLVSRPEEAVVAPAARFALERLRQQLDLVAVVTGRETDVARSMLGVEGLRYIGSYALSESRLLGEESEAIEHACHLVEPYLQRLPGVTLEKKDVSFALHYRNCEDPDAMRSRIITLLEPIAAAAGGKLLEGKLVIEVAPSTLPDKGTAFALLLRDEAIRGAIFAGDDLADTAIFREIRRRRLDGLPGLAIGVVDDETPPAVIDASDMHLAGVSEVEAFLTALADRLEKRQA